MRIDPSQLTEPLSHVLSSGAADAAGGQKATQAASRVREINNIDRLDQMLLKALSANSTSEAADSVLSFQDAQLRLDQLQKLMARDMASIQSAQGNLDGARVRGLLGN